MTQAEQTLLEVTERVTGTGYTIPVALEAMEAFGRLCIKKTVETAKHHVDGDFDAEGTEANALLQMNLTSDELRGTAV